MVNKLRNFIKNRAVIFTFLLVFTVFIGLKIINLDNYFFYDGKIIGLHKAATNHTSAGRGSSLLITRKIPEIEYYKSKDTIRCYQKDLRLVTNFELNEKITVMFEKENDNKTKAKIYSLFYYWIDYNELILLLFVFIFILGFIKNFM